MNLDTIKAILIKNNFILETAYVDEDDESVCVTSNHPFTSEYLVKQAFAGMEEGVGFLQFGHRVIVYIS